MTRTECISTRGAKFVRISYAAWSMVAWSMVAWLTVVLSQHSLGQLPERSTAQTNEAPPMLREWHRMRDEIRSKLSPLREPKYRFEFLRSLDDKSTSPFRYESLPPRIVVVMGGLQSNSQAASQFAYGLAQKLQGKKIAFAVFQYPNDGTLVESASVLRYYLNTLATRSPQSKVTLVAHSMGGLACRWALESPASNDSPAPNNVDSLLMIFPPNHGSVLAQYARALELGDLVEKTKSDGFSISTLLEAFLHDGMGEACDELIPESDFLCTLNGMPRKEAISYSIAMGTGGPLTPARQLLASTAVSAMKAQWKPGSPELQWLIDRGEELLNADELVKGLGDGAVSLQSASLPSVRDMKRFPLHHVQWSDTSLPEVNQLLDWVTERIR